MRPLVQAALAELGIERFVLAVHERMFPGEGADLGCGTPASPGAQALVSLAGTLGFTALQLGPSGRISEVNLSPYDGTVFSRSPLAFSWDALAAEHPALVDEALLARFSAPASERADMPRAFQAADALWAELHRRWDSAPPPDLQRDVEFFQTAEVSWLVPDALFEVTWPRYGTTDPRQWGDPPMQALWQPGSERAAAALVERQRWAVERTAREQFLLWREHDTLRRRARAEGLEVLADLQAGLSHAERWTRAAVLLPGFAMGAPPSRTNPLGQPWGYPVIDPGATGTLERPGEGLALMQLRAHKAFREYDGVRIDHPHAVVCPWVYAEGAADPHAAVRAGARLFSVGPRVPALRAFDIARDEQRDEAVDPWADRYVTGLDDGQIDRYAVMMDAVVEAAHRAGRPTSAVACEALSTMPVPLGAVLARHRLGRFRVTQKADVTDATDVYLPANAQPEDWIMVGTHDTPPLWAVVEAWPDARARARAAWLARWLAPDGACRDELGQFFEASRHALALGELAALFTGPARHVMVFAADLFGETTTYNRPGEVHPDNWVLRCPPASDHQRRLGRGAALDVAACLALALSASPRASVRRHRAPLVARLRAHARVSIPLLSERMI